MTTEVPLYRRRELCTVEVTLDGRPAVICGARNDRATVATVPDGPSYTWAWPTVERIVANGGRFRS